METTINKTVKGKDMAAIFDNCEDFSIRFYDAGAIDNYNEEKEYNYQIVLRHNEGTNAKKLFAAELKRIKAINNNTETEIQEIVSYPEGDILEIPANKLDGLIKKGLVFLDDEFTKEKPTGQYGFNGEDENKIRKAIIQTDKVIQHTKGEWRVEDTGNVKSALITDGEWGYIALTYGESYSARIIKCVNNHDLLIDALREIEDRLSQEGEDVWEVELNICREALKNAE